MLLKNFQKLYLGEILLIGIIFFAVSCAQSYNPNIERGSDYKFRAGYPQVQFEAIGIVSQENEPLINIIAEIRYESLIFREENDHQNSKIAVHVQVFDEEENILNKENYKIEIDPTNDGKSGQSHIFETQLETTPDAHRADITITDLYSNKQITRTTNISIPDLSEDKTNLSNISMSGKNSDSESSWVPITTYDIPSRIDSLKFRFQVTNNSDQEPLAVNTKLINIKSDNSVARPVFFRDYSSSTIEYSGLNYDDKSIEMESTRNIAEEGNIFIEFRFANLDKGNYRFEVQTQEKEELFKARDFGVKSENYPLLQTPRELARPLIYLMNDNNYENLLSIQNQDSLKITIDKFWLKEIGNKEEAQRALEKFYTRVEEANKQFSNFKEGWKTDPGMIYILFGHPDFVRYSMNGMIWNYSKNTVTSNRTFHFNKPTVKGSSFPFDHYLLQRNKAYYSLVYQQKQLWRSGLILQRDF